MDIDNDIVMRETEAMRKICEYVWDNYMDGNLPKCTMNGFTSDLRNTDHFMMSIADSKTFPMEGASCIQINMSDKNMRNRIIFFQYPEGVSEPTPKDLKNMTHAVDGYFNNVCASDYVDNLIIIAGKKGKPMPFNDKALEKMTDLVIASQNSKNPTCVSYMLAGPDKLFSELDNTINVALVDRYKQEEAEKARLAAEKAKRQSYLDYLDNFSIAHKPNIKSAEQVREEVEHNKKSSYDKKAHLVPKTKVPNIKATNQYNSLDR